MTTLASTPNRYSPEAFRSTKGDWQVYVATRRLGRCLNRMLRILRPAVAEKRVYLWTANNRLQQVFLNADQRCLDRWGTTTGILWAPQLPSPYEAVTPTS